MPSDSRNLPEQERSIKARSHELFVEPERTGTGKPVKPFPVYLRETPADPMSPANQGSTLVRGHRRRRVVPGRDLAGHHAPCSPATAETRRQGLAS